MGFLKYIISVIKMGPFEKFIYRRCRELDSLREYFPEYGSDIDNIKVSLFSWISPYMVRELEAKYIFLHKKLGIQPDTFLNWIQVSVAIFSNELTEQFGKMQKEGTLPITKEEYHQLWREKMSDKMASLYGINRNNYLKACGGTVK